MERQNQNISLQNALRGYFPEKDPTELDSDLERLFDTLSGDELVDPVIERVQRHAVEACGKKMHRDFRHLAPFDIEAIKRVIHEELKEYISSFISDEHREFIVRCHARGLSTSDAIVELIRTDYVMNRLADEDAMGVKRLQKMLIRRLAYLKPGAVRWPKKKYGQVWREEREQYKRAMNDIPFTSQVEQVALLAKQADRISRELENETHSLEDLELLTTLLVKVMESLRKVSLIEAPMPVDLSGPQLVAVLERLTLALKAPEEKAELVGMLEQLVLTLKAPELEADGSETKALPAGTEGDGDETE